MQQTKSSNKWNAWGDTNPGKKRDNNEDRILCDAAHGIFVVADGMGGEAAGEVAAQIAIDFIKKRLGAETGTAARRLREAITGANNEICRLAEGHPEWKGMACVLTAALVEDQTLHIGHVGDSRLYQIIDDTIRKITPDHSPVGQKEDSGELTELEAMRHPRRNEVYRDVGSRAHKPDDEDFIEYIQIPFNRDAAYVLCSDGLSDMLTSREISAAVVENAGSPRDSVRRLIEKANSAGGKDNISAIVVEAENFAAAARNTSKPRRVLSVPAFIGGRWAFLLYGLVAGLLASYLWLRPAGPENGPVDDKQSVPLPRVLQVGPAGAEYSSIAGALEAAQAGDRIEIADGEYEESVRLKEGVSILAQTPGRAMLRISRVLPDVDAAIYADGIQRASISGLVVKADPGASLPFGIRISNSNVSIANVEVSGALKAGILIEGNSKSVLYGSQIHANTGPGIKISGAATPLVIGNLVSGNGTSRLRDPGLYVAGNSNPEVKRNVFRENGGEAIRLQRKELKNKMTDNIFINSGRSPVTVERLQQ